MEWAYRSPVTFSLTGGFAVALVFTLIGWLTFGRIAGTQVLNPQDALGRLCAMRPMTGKSDSWASWYPKDDKKLPNGLMMVNRTAFSDWLDSLHNAAGIEPQLKQLRHSLAMASPAFEPYPEPNEYPRPWSNTMSLSNEDLLQIKAMQSTIEASAKAAGVPVEVEKLPIKG